MVKKIVASGAKPAAAKPKAKKAPAKVEDKPKAAKAAPAKKAPAKVEDKPKAVKVALAKKAPEKEAKVDYSKMTVAELKAIAKDKGISGYTSFKKAELISALNQ
jgi:hypothetical protein